MGHGEHLQARAPLRTQVADTRQQNKTLSDDTDRILQMVNPPKYPTSNLSISEAQQQGVGWWLRKAIALATVTLTIKQYTSDDGLTHIDIEQRATGGISGTTENRTLDWEYRDHKDGIFGEVKGKSRWVKLSDVEDDNEFLKKGWLDEGDKYVQSYVESVGNGWTANQVRSSCGFGSVLGGLG